jgi:hypothetical protein
MDKKSLRASVMQRQQLPLVYKHRYQSSAARGSIAPPPCNNSDFATSAPDVLSFSCRFGYHFATVRTIGINLGTVFGDNHPGGKMDQPRINWRLMRIVTRKTIGILADLNVPLGSCQTTPDGEHPAWSETLPAPNPDNQPVASKRKLARHKWKISATSTRNHRDGNAKESRN